MEEVIVPNREAEAKDQEEANMQEVHYTVAKAREMTSNLLSFHKAFTAEELTSIWAETVSTALPNFNLLYVETSKEEKVA